MSNIHHPREHKHEQNTKKNKKKNEETKMPKLVCSTCGKEENVPMHCGQAMHIEGDQLVCWMGPGCGHQDIPQCHGSPMEIKE